MLNDPWIAALFALFIWWFSTGAILMAVRYADRRGPRAGHLATVCAVPMLAAGVAGILYETAPSSLSARRRRHSIYVSFLSALAIWGWIEMAFLTGSVTGPNRNVCPQGRTGVGALHPRLGHDRLSRDGAGGGADRPVVLCPRKPQHLCLLDLCGAVLCPHLGQAEPVPGRAQDQHRVPAVGAVAPAQPFPPRTDQLAVPGLRHGAFARRGLLARADRLGTDRPAR